MENNGPIQIIDLSGVDFNDWLRLWQSYLNFYETNLPISTIDQTWKNLLDENVAIYRFGAWSDNRLIGITHVVLHPNTWNTTEYCYLGDLYVDDAIRGQRVGRKLIEHVYNVASDKGCNRVYWVTHEGNTPVRALYDTLATQTDMMQYRKNL